MANALNDNSRVKDLRYCSGSTRFYNGVYETISASRTMSVCLFLSPLHSYEKRKLLIVCDMNFTWHIKHKCEGLHLSADNLNNSFGLPFNKSATPLTTAAWRDFFLGSSNVPTNFYVFIFYILAEPRWLATWQKCFIINILLCNNS